MHWKLAQLSDSKLRNSSSDFEVRTTITVTADWEPLSLILEVLLPRQEGNFAVGSFGGEQKEELFAPIQSIEQ